MLPGRQDYRFLRSFFESFEFCFPRAALGSSRDSAAGARSRKATVMATHKQSNCAEIADVIGVEVRGSDWLDLFGACAPRCREFFLFLCGFRRASGACRRCERN